MRKVLVASMITALLLTGCAAQEGKTTVSSDVQVTPKPTEFVLNVQPLYYKLDVEKEMPTVEVASVEEEQESSVSPFLVAHMVEHNLPEETAEKYANYIITSSEENVLDPFTVLAIIHVETGGTFKFDDHPNSHGAIGLMQILRRNVKCNETDSCTQEVWKGYSEKDLYNPEKNIELGTKYLKYLQDRFGHDLGITAYNQGEGNVSRGTYNTKYFNRVHNVFKSIEGNDYETKSSATN